VGDFPPYSRVSEDASDNRNGSETSGEPSTSGETDTFNEVAEDKAIGCDLASLLPDAEANLTTVKMEEMEDLPPCDMKHTGGDLQGLMMDGLKGDACSDLVSNFVDDVTTDPVSLDDFLEI